MDTVNQHPTTTHFSIQEILHQNRTALFVESKPSVWSEKTMRIMPHPHLPLSLLPSQKQHRQVTSCHSMRVVSAHSSTRLFAPLLAHRSASVLCSRKVWVIHSAVRPRPRHSRRMFWAFFSTVGTLVFILACPFTQSSIVLLSPLISSVRPTPGTGMPRTRGGRSLGFLSGTWSFGLLFLVHWLFHRLEEVPNDVFPARM